MSTTATSASNINEVFRKPAIKLFAGQLMQNCNKSSSRSQWNLILTQPGVSGPSKHIEFLVAWVQGTVEKVNGETVLLTDETGTVEVRTPSLIGMPPSRNTLQTGMYCAAVGEVSEVGRIPKIRAYKFTVLEENILKPFWRYEVEDYQRFLIQRKNSIV